MAGAALTGARPDFIDAWAKKRRTTLGDALVAALKAAHAMFL
jgi:hypothetical protein